MPILTRRGSGKKPNLQPLETSDDMAHKQNDATSRPSLKRLGSSSRGRLSVTNPAEPEQRLGGIAKNRKGSTSRVLQSKTPISDAYIAERITRDRAERTSLLRARLPPSPEIVNARSGYEIAYAAKVRYSQTPCNCPLKELTRSGVHVKGPYFHEGKMPSHEMTTRTDHFFGVSNPPPHVWDSLLRMQSENGEEELDGDKELVEEFVENHTVLGNWTPNGDVTSTVGWPT